MSKLGMVSSFHPHSMCKRVERVTAKTGCTSCTNWTISFGVSGFRTRTHVWHWHFIFLNLLQLQTFLRSVRTIQSDVINFQHFLRSFAIFQSFTDLFREPNDREIENHYKMNSEKVETWQGIIIHPHSMCKKVERITAKTGCISCIKRTISFEASGFHTETCLLQRDFIFFELIWTP